MFETATLAKAYEALPPNLRDTPLVSARTPGLTLKLETLQPTGAYKLRAAYLKLRAYKGGPGMALSSSGNFAAAFTWAADQLGVPVHLVVTKGVAEHKMELARQYPCQVHVCGSSYESRFLKLQELADRGIEAIDHRTDQEVFLGHATIGWECVQHKDRFQRVLIPLSTGGLALGVAAALRAGGFEGEIVGVQPAGNPTLYRSWQTGEPVSLPSIETVCDALTATSVPRETYLLLREYLDDVILVQESSVLRAVGYLALEEGVVAEPGAAVGVAALLERQRPWSGTLCLVTGRNLERGVLLRGIEQHGIASIEGV